MALKNKYQREKQQYSTDGGITWFDVTPPNYRKGRVIETASEDCNYALEYLTFVALEDCTFSVDQNSHQYSTDDGATWTTLEANTPTPTIGSGSKIMWKRAEQPDGGVGTFSSTGRFDVQGNIMSLLYGDNFDNQTSLEGKDTAFRSLFLSNTYLVNAQNLILPATTLAEGCYNRMFQGCTSLVTAPELPATTLTDGCYQSMFSGCTSLVTAPAVLPATTLTVYCYNYMFSDCTSLVTAPVLPATTLTDHCYAYMFVGCTSLATAPALPATTLATYCYSNMFYSCTSLVTAPVLPATTLAYNCYREMFNGCTSLVTAPELPATTLISSCYFSMFYNCASLNYIKAMFTTTPSERYTYKWVENVAASGTFVKNSAATWEVTGNNGIPSGWTVQTASS